MNDTNASQPVEKALAVIQRLERTFDILLVLESLISAALYANASTILSVRFSVGEISEEDAIRYLNWDLRLFFAPLLLGISLWMISRAIFGTELSRRRMIRSAQTLIHSLGFSFLLFLLWVYIGNFIAGSISVQLITGLTDVMIYSLNILFLPFLALATYVNYSYLTARDILKTARRNSKGRKQISWDIFSSMAIALWAYLLLDIVARWLWNAAKVL